MSRHSFNLERFTEAQAPVYPQVLQELRAGEKRTHWMWFIFPQLSGLGSSAMAERYAIGSLDEARTYLAHPVLGQRLRECTTLVNNVQGRTAGQIFGWPDELKFRSCMTLFAQASSGSEFQAALEKYCGGAGDEETLQHLP